MGSILRNIAFGKWRLVTANEPAFFPVGASGSGSNNLLATNEGDARQRYVKELAKSRNPKRALSNLILHNSTGLLKDLLPDKNSEAEIKFVSTMRLQDVLAPFARVDYLEADIQSAEKIVFPPAIETLNRKVRRIHLGTHGADAHYPLLELFKQHGWEIIFAYEGEKTHASPLGPVTVNDGILSVINPRLA